MEKSLEHKHLKASHTPLESAVSVDSLRLSRVSSDKRLGNTPITFRKSSKDTEKRRNRWLLRDELREITRIERVKKCGKVPIMKGGVELREGCGETHKAGFHGLMKCGSVWVCPVCSAKIAASRKQTLDNVLQRAQKEGLYISLLTLTMRHNQGQRLADLWDALSYAWSRVIGGEKFKSFKTQLGLKGYCRAVELTHGSSGWHVHQHCLILSEKNPSDTLLIFQRKQGRRKTPYPPEFVRPSDYISSRWSKALSKRGIGFIKDSGGLDWQVATRGDEKALSTYLVKMGVKSADGLASETTLGAFKQARSKTNRTPFQILADIAENGEESDIKLWHEFERASFGKRAMTCSNGLLDWGNIEFKTDQEILDNEDTGGECIAVFDKSEWARVYKRGAVTLLETLETKGRTAVYKLLEDWGIIYRNPLIDPFSWEVSNDENEDPGGS